MKNIWQFVGMNEGKCFWITNNKYDKKIILHDEWGYEFHEFGFSISVDCKKSVIKNIFLFSENYGKGYKKYNSKLPFDIDFNMDKVTVRKKCGLPYFSRGSLQSIIGFVPPLDSYLFEGKKYSIEYLPDFSGINLICIFCDL